MISDAIQEAAVLHKEHTGETPNRVRMPPLTFQLLTTEFTGSSNVIHTTVGNLTVQSDTNVDTITVDRE